MNRWFAVLLLGAFGCAADAPVIVVIIDTDLEIPTQTDGVEVVATASRNLEGFVCEPFEPLLALEEGSDLPLRLGFRAGSLYNSWLALRVRALLGTRELFRYESRWRWPVEGNVEQEIFLDSRCLEMSCGENEHCYEGACEGVPEPGIFDNDERVDQGVPCDSDLPM